MRVAVMQPTYLPWIGYFGMIDRVNTFVFLDSVQYAKRSWQQRNQIKTANGPIWLTVPVISKGRGQQLISDVEIDVSRNFQDSHIASLEHNYRKAPYYSNYSDELFSLLGKGHAHLSELTIELIAWFCEALGISTSLMHSSAMENAGTRAELLAMLCEQVDASEYISAPGSREYLEESDAFSRRGIKINYNDYEHPEYPQLYGEFTPYMSIVDLLFNMGPESLATIRKGYGQ